MTVTIEPLLHADINEFIKVWWESFEPLSADQVLPMIYPQGLSPELINRLRIRIMETTNGDTVEFCFVAREQETKKIVGIAWWSTLTKPKIEAPAIEANVEGSELDALLRKKNSGDPVPGMNEALGDAFYTAIFEAERTAIKAKKVPYIGLNLLAVLPSHERQGIGGMLLQKGLESVDQLNVWTFLIASSTGKGLYTKNEFEIIEPLDFDGTKYGGRSKASHWIMLRPPQNA